MRLGKNDNKKNYCEVLIADYQNALWSYKLPCEKVSFVLSSASLSRRHKKKPNRIMRFKVIKKIYDSDLCNQSMVQ